MEAGRQVIHVSAPAFLGREAEYVADVMASGWLTQGPYTERLEAAVCDFTGAPYAVGCNTGTAALHLALLGLNVGPKDHVIVPALSYIATANAVTYCGAHITFADVDPLTWCLDPDVVPRLVDQAASGGRPVTGIIGAHLFDAVCDLDAITDAAPDAWVLEDAAQAIGASYDGHHVGLLTAGATLSFYASKTIAAGEGGMVLTSDEAMKDQAVLHRGQGNAKRGVYEHEVVGHNYRMSEFSAAVALAQLECYDKHRSRREVIMQYYREALPMVLPDVQLQETAEYSDGGRWICAVQLPDGTDTEKVRGRMLAAGVETRPFFRPLHLTGAYLSGHAMTEAPVAQKLADRGLMLPTHTSMKTEHADRVIMKLKEAMR